MRGDGRRVNRPVGVAVGQDGPKLEGHIDVIVGRDDLAGVGPAFEHYPRHFRVVGRFAVLRGNLPELMQSGAIGGEAGPGATIPASTGPADWDLKALMKRVAGLPPLPAGE